MNIWSFNSNITSKILVCLSLLWSVYLSGWSWEWLQQINYGGNCELLLINVWLLKIEQASWSIPTWSLCAGYSWSEWKDFAPSCDTYSCIHRMQWRLLSLTLLIYRSSSSVPSYAILHKLIQLLIPSFISPLNPQTVSLSQLWAIILHRAHQLSYHEFPSKTQHKSLLDLSSACCI